jgi:hypothetical protein
VPGPPEYVTVCLPHVDRDEATVAIAMWNMLWEVAQFRRRLFSADELPPELSKVADRGDVNVGIFGRLAQAKVDPGCCQLLVVSVRRRRLEWGIWTQSAGVEAPGCSLGASRRVCAGVLMGLWWRCFGPGRSLGLVLGGGRLGGLCAVVAGGGAGRLAGWVGSVGESSYSAERGERGRGEQDVVEPAGGAGAGGVGDRGAGGGRDHGGYPGAGAGGNSGGQPVDGAGRAGRPARAGRVAVVTREA